MKKHPDYHLLGLAIFMFIFSLLFFACLSAPASLQRFGNPNYYLFHQILYGFLPAIVAGFAAYKIPLTFWKKWAPVFVIFNLIALFIVFLPVIGVKIGGASRWINFGKFVVQPSEFLKITAIMYLSAWIASKLADTGSGWKNTVKNEYHNILFILIPFAVFLGIITTALFFQKDASTLGIISLSLLAVYFSAKTPLWHTGLITGSGTFFLLLLVKLESYRMDRWLVFLNPDNDPLGKGFQLRQALISIGSGGIFGNGLGMSTQKFGYLPQAMSDSIFAIIGEELGLIGCAILIASFVYLFWLGIKISRNSTDKFSKLASVGIVVWIILQTFINMASSAGIFPLAGIPLPFFSYGGSHLMVECFSIGLLLNMSKNT
jgi:cell division protein FtsW